MRWRWPGRCASPRPPFAECFRGCTVNTQRQLEDRDASATGGYYGGRLWLAIGLRAREGRLANNSVNNSGSGQPTITYVRGAGGCAFGAQ
jgi:hypothetical protein